MCESQQQLVERLVADLIEAAVFITPSVSGQINPSAGITSQARTTVNSANNSNKSLVGAGHLCDLEFGVEALEVEGPADAWLLDNVNNSFTATSSGHEDAVKMLKKDKSWQEFQEVMDLVRQQSLEDVESRNNKSTEGVPSLSSRCVLQPQNRDRLTKPCTTFRKMNHNCTRRFISFYFRARH
jgi:hypothetical protein